MGLRLAINAAVCPLWFQPALQATVHGPAFIRLQRFMPCCLWLSPAKCLLFPMLAWALHPSSASTPGPTNLLGFLVIMFWKTGVVALNFAQVFCLNCKIVPFEGRKSRRYRSEAPFWGCLMGPANLQSFTLPVTGILSAATENILGHLNDSRAFSCVDPVVLNKTHVLDPGAFPCNDKCRWPHVMMSGLRPLFASLCMKFTWARKSAKTGWR